MLTTTNDLKDKHFRLPAADLAALVDEAHECTLGLIADLDDGQFTVPLLETVNPFLWELGHVAFFYDAFLSRLLDGTPLVMEGSGTLYDSFLVAHDDRWSLPLPSRQTTLDYKNRVREGVLARLNGRAPDAAPDAGETYLHLLALMHEDMHIEAFTYMRQTLEYSAPRQAAGNMAPLGEGGPLLGDVEIPGGTFRLGSLPEYPFVFDNEKWAHEVELKPFRIARAPVTNGEFAEFIEAGGYRRDELWSYEGLLWRTRGGVQHPVYWARGADGGWLRRHFDRLMPIEEHAPVAHVTWHEAEAYCAWAGRRLPSEAEWEMAATVEPGNGGAKGKRRYPWGDEPPGPALANLDSRHMGCVDVGAFAAGDSPLGCRQMIGNVWEWTASPFYPFPGYVVDFPYKEYSAPWFGYCKILKGGSWATRPRFASNARRNYFLPYRNDGYAGFRTCAREG